MTALETIEEAMTFLRQVGHHIGLPVALPSEGGWHIPIDGKPCNYEDIVRLAAQEKNTKAAA